MVLLRKLKGSPISRIYPLLLMIKLVVFLIIANISLVMGKGIAQNVSLTAKNISLVDAMKSIKRQSGVAYFLNGKDNANYTSDIQLRVANDKKSFVMYVLGTNGGVSAIKFTD